MSRPVLGGAGSHRALGSPALPRTSPGPPPGVSSRHRRPRGHHLVGECAVNAIAVVKDDCASWYAAAGWIRSPTRVSVSRLGRRGDRRLRRAERVRVPACSSTPADGRAPSSDEVAASVRCNGLWQTVDALEHVRQVRLGNAVRLAVTSQRGGTLDGSWRHARELSGGQGDAGHRPCGCPWTRTRCQANGNTCGWRGGVYDQDRVRKSSSPSNANVGKASPWEQAGPNSRTPRPAASAAPWSQGWSQEPAESHGGRRTLMNAIMPLTCANADLHGLGRTTTNGLCRSSNPATPTDRRPVRLVPPGWPAVVVLDRPPIPRSPSPCRILQWTRPSSTEIEIKDRAVGPAVRLTLGGAGPGGRRGRHAGRTAATTPPAGRRA